MTMVRLGKVVVDRYTTYTAGSDGVVEVLLDTSARLVWVRTQGEWHGNRFLESAIALPSWERACTWPEAEGTPWAPVPRVPPARPAPLAPLARLLRQRGGSNAGAR